MTLEYIVSKLTTRFASDDYIDLTSSDSVTISGNPTLELFFLGDDDQTIADIVANGVRFLRVGFYKLVGPAVYRTDIHPPTFMATVLYLGEDDQEVIKFKCNVGPMTNAKVVYGHNYLTHPNETHELFKTFAEMRKDSTDGHNFYYTSKRWFFDELYAQQRIFVIEKEVLIPPSTSDDQSYREVQWRLLT